MIKSIVNITTPEDYLKLLEIIPDDYWSGSLIKDFQQTLSESVQTVVVEYPYIDKDYRSTYYGFYSKRHRTYSKFCIRLHLFKGHIDNEEGLSDYSSDYMGSMVLRPTEVTPLGRTLLSPLAIKSFQGYICEATFENNLMGVPLRISSFPHLMQDTDVTVCAHAVCWMIARYYSEKYPFMLIHDRGKMIIHDRVFKGELFQVVFSHSLAPFQLFKNNLRSYS